MTTKVEKNITVDVPVSTAYNQWTQFESFPEFLSGVQKVEQLDDRRLHWVAEIAGRRHRADLCHAPRGALNEGPASTGAGLSGVRGASCRRARGRRHPPGPMVLRG